MQSKEGKGLSGMRESGNRNGKGDMVLKEEETLLAGLESALVWAGSTT